MTVISPAPADVSDDLPADNRRATVRAASCEILKGLAALARLGGGDMIQFLVFTGVWTANVEHLVTDSGRFAELQSIPPDSLRRPVSMPELQWRTALPGDILERYVERLVDEGTVERLPSGGLVVPTAVFTRPEQLASAGEVYTRMLGLVEALRRAGFSLGDGES